MVSFWKYGKPRYPLEFLCLGILIRSNWIFLTTICADKWGPFDDIVIQYGGYAIHNIFLEESKILDKKVVTPGSKFSIVYVSNSTFY